MIKVIKNNAEYETALREVERLTERDPPAGTREADRLELLALLVSTYEEQHFPIESPDPVEAIKFRMEQLGIKQKDLAPCFTSPGKASEVLNRKRPLTLPMVRRLHQNLGIPTGVLVKTYALKSHAMTSKRTNFARPGKNRSAILNYKKNHVMIHA